MGKRRRRRAQRIEQPLAAPVLLLESGSQVAKAASGAILPLASMLLAPALVPALCVYRADRLHPRPCPLLRESAWTVERWLCASVRRWFGVATAGRGRIDRPSRIGSLSAATIDKIAL